MAERVRDVSDHDLALYRAIVGHKPATTPAAHRLARWRRCLAAFATPGSRIECLLQLARQRLREGLRRFGLTTRL